MAMKRIERKKMRKVYNQKTMPEKVCKAEKPKRSPNTINQNVCRSNIDYPSWNNWNQEHQPEIKKLAQNFFEEEEFGIPQCPPKYESTIKATPRPSTTTDASFLKEASSMRTNIETPTGEDSATANKLKDIFTKLEERYDMHGQLTNCRVVKNDAGWAVCSSKDEMGLGPRDLFGKLERKITGLNDCLKISAFRRANGLVVENFGRGSGSHSWFAYAVPSPASATVENLVEYWTKLATGGFKTVEQLKEEKDAANPFIALEKTVEKAVANIAGTLANVKPDWIREALYDEAYQRILEEKPPEKYPSVRYGFEPLPIVILPKIPEKHTRQEYKSITAKCDEVEALLKNEKINAAVDRGEETLAKKKSDWKKQNAVIMTLDAKNIANNTITMLVDGKDRAVPIDLLISNLKSITNVVEAEEKKASQSDILEPVILDIEKMLEPFTQKWLKKAVLQNARHYSPENGINYKDFPADDEPYEVTMRGGI